MAATYSVQMPQVAPCQEELNAAHKAIVEAINNLETTTESSLQEWEGSVRDIYRQQKLKWDAATEAMAAAMGKASQALGQINESYNHAEKTGTSMWGG
jgi:uncharacterized protein YukE